MAFLGKRRARQGKGTAGDRMADLSRWPFSQCGLVVDTWIGQILDFDISIDTAIQPNDQRRNQTRNRGNSAAGRTRSAWIFASWPDT